ncbi:hypothetical protein GB937_005310 [Aspergillus fischeri]|nr:hypothetical protein GB937_005310 [Aspergillus fischeri]
MAPKGTPSPTPIARSWDEGDELSPVGVGQAVLVVDTEFDDVVIDEEFEQGAFSRRTTSWPGYW